MVESGFTARGGAAGTPVRWLPSLRRTASRSSFLGLPRVRWLESFGLNWRRASGILTLGSTTAGSDTKVADGGGSTFSASTVVHGLTWDLLTPRLGSWASPFSPRDPSPVQLLREAVNWCSRHPLQALGFDPKRAKIRAPWPPIYRGFGLITKRIRLRSHLDPSIKLVSTLVRFNLAGKTPRALRARVELGRAVILGSVTSGQLGRLVAYRAAHGGVSSGRFTGCVQERDPASSWACE
jgi:hypothetical protein